MRPVDPAFLLVCAWKHGNYWPTSVPLDFKVRAEFDRKSANVSALLYPQLVPNVDYTRNSSVRKELYKYLFYRFIPDSRYWAVFQGEEIGSDIEQKLRGVQVR